MKKKSQYIDRRQHASLKTQSIVVRVHNSKDFVKSDRIEWLKLLHAEWLAKRSSIFNNNKEIYLINEPDELDIEVYW
ncbi:MAG: hypothetical protein OES33_09195 [Desulfobulbaceae bacterium]|jgi:hypothetical protein|nr:hypothetical protein [Desulfobacteraceae bacterium]MDH3782877.1 hypothetical protein [Desulfobulbaceae bacterium]